MRLPFAWPHLLWMVVIFMLSSLEPQDIPVAPPFPFFDKLVHALLFGILVLTHHPPARARLTPGEWLPCAVVSAAVFAVSDELHQLLVAGRDADVWDVVADGVGIFAAALMARATWLQFLVYRILR